MKIVKYLFIGEKPSLTREVEACYRNHMSEINNKLGEIDFVALSGHVCTNYEPTDYADWADAKWGDVDYPMIPQRWGIKVIDDVRKRKTVKSIKDTVRNYDGIIVGTDSDLEGYGIYFLLEQYLKISDMKALRFIEHSLTDSEILESLLNMTDYHTDPKHVQFTQSFLLRSRADWLYGMNATRMMSVKMQDVLAIGRVKAPTIKLVYDNSMAIDNFVPKNYFIAEADYGNFKAEYAEDTKKTTAFDNKKDIPDFPLHGVVKTKATKKVLTHAPKLYDLSAIQAEAGSTYGYSPTETLSTIQSLYETHKVISYPRTQCRFVSSEKAKEFKMMLRNMSAFEDLKPLAQAISDEDIARVMKDKQVVNDKEVNKESHDALLPTDNKPDLSKLNDAETKICHMIYKRLLAQFLPQLEENKTHLVIMHGEYPFIVNGKVVLNQGWKKLYGSSKDNILPDLSEGDTVTAEKIEPIERTTVPPKRLTQATLLNAMENIAKQIEDPELRKSLADSKGIGTPATRDSIISDIIKRGYVEEKKKGLYITKSGKRYIESIDKLNIASPVFAAIIDTDIKKIQRGEASYEDVYNKILDNLNDMCSQIDEIPSKRIIVEEKCPKCGTNFTAERYEYVCYNCGYKLSRRIAGVEVTKEMLQTMLEGNSTKTYTFTKKNGDTFRGKLKLTSEGLSFDYKSGITCPLCGKENITMNRGGVFCDNEDCDFKLFRKMAGHIFNDYEIKKLINEGCVRGIKDFKNKKGENFPATVILNDEGEVKFQFEK